MKKTYLFCALIAFVFCSCNSPKEKLVISGSGWKQIAIVDKQTGQIEWSHSIDKSEDCNDVERTPDGNILYAYAKGARLITPKQEVVWDYKAQQNEDLNTAIYLSNGNYLLAMCGHPARIIELNKKGEMVSEVTFETGIEKPHSQFRQVFKTPSNTYLVPLMGKGEVIEINAEGDILNMVPCGGNPFSVLLLNNGNWLVACGDAHRFVEINPTDKQIVKQVSSDDVDNASLLFVGEIIRYNNGNTLISNWNGHSKDKSQPLLLELDQNNHVVWSLPLNESIKNISTVYSYNE